MKSYRGFTIVELLVVIVVIAALTLITIFAFGSWRQRTARTEMQSELRAIASSLETYRTFNNSYPGAEGGSPVSPATLLGSSYKPNNGVVATYALRVGGGSFCLKATSVAVPDEPAWYIDSAKSKEPDLAVCN